jgi:hypothetical protein
MAGAGNFMFRTSPKIQLGIFFHRGSGLKFLTFPGFPIKKVLSKNKNTVSFFRVKKMDF